MAILTAIISILILSLIIVYVEPLPQSQCLKNGICVHPSQCILKNNEDIILYPCQHSWHEICCPVQMINPLASEPQVAQPLAGGLPAGKPIAAKPPASKPPVSKPLAGKPSSGKPQSLKNRGAKLLPSDCGIIAEDNKISGGQAAYPGQFPWMALLGYKQRILESIQFLCGGSLITSKYVLTAAHCIKIDRSFELILVRLGELDTTTDIDCVEYKFGNKTVNDCADKHVDILIDKVLAHPEFDTRRVNYKNDIALIKLERAVKFTDFIKPICLPFTKTLQEEHFVERNFSISGWGKMKSGDLGGSTILQYTAVHAWNLTHCNNNVPPDVLPIIDTQLCASGWIREDACKGDSGGPLSNSSIVKEGQRCTQVGVVSFGSTIACGNPTLPTIYTRVDKFIDWILSSLERNLEV